MLIKPTPGIVFGLQKGPGNNYETVQKQISTSNDLVFTLTIKIKCYRTKDKLPKLSGSSFKALPVISLYILTSAHTPDNLVKYGRDGLKSL